MNGKFSLLRKYTEKVVEQLFINLVESNNCSTLLKIEKKKNPIHIHTKYLRDTQKQKNM